jgi:hypothetical protein
MTVFINFFGFFNGGRARLIHAVINDLLTRGYNSNVCVLYWPGQMSDLYRSKDFIVTNFDLPMLEIQHNDGLSVNIFVRQFDVRMEMEALLLQHVTEEVDPENLLEVQANAIHASAIVDRAIALRK